MITKTVFLASLDTGAFLLGYAGENKHIRYDIRCDSIFSDYPDATVSMLIKSPDGTVYPKVLTIDKPSVYWVVTASDTATDGNGKVQITFTNGDEVIKTVEASTVTMPSLFVSGEEPDPIATWIDDANEVLGQVQSALEEIPAEIQTEVAAQMSSTVDDWLEENITNPSSPPLDRSLTLSNAAAPADLVGTKADAIYDTVTDQAIATVSDGANGMVVKELSVAVTPVQDLHGQSNPYPAGGGKNLFDPSVLLTATGWTESNGEYSGMSEALNNMQFLTSILPYEGQMAISLKCKTESGRAGYLWIKYSDDSTSYVEFNSTSGYISKTLVTTSGKTISQIFYGKSNNYKLYLMDIQIEYGSSVTSFAPYSNLCPITGWTGAIVSRTGANLFNIDDSNGWVTPTGGAISTSGSTISMKILGGGGTKYIHEQKFPPNVTVTFSGVPSKHQSRIFIFCQKLDNSGAMSSSDATISGFTYNSYFGGWYADMGEAATFSKTAVIPNCLWWKVGVGYNNVNVTTGDTETISNFQIEFGSSATAYAPYAGQTYAISFPGTAGTVYGGTLNATTGVLTVNRVNIVFTGAQSENWGTYRSDGTSSLNSFRLKLSTETVLEAWGSGTANNAICNMATANGTAIYNHSAISFAIDSSQYAYICLPVTSVETLKTYLSQNNLQMCATLATSVTYTLTAAQVTTLLGTNNVWADCGDIAKLEYPADTKLYINKVIAAAVAAL